MTLDPEKRNVFLLKFAGKAEIPEGLKIGDNYKITIDGTITGVEEKDNNDGSHTLLHKIEPIRVEMIDELGRAIQAKDTRSNSQRTRMWFYKAWINNAASYDFERLWDEVNAIFCARRDMIIEDAEKRMGI